MKILVVLLRFDNGDNPYNPDSTDKVNGYVIPLGLAYIATVLKRIGQDVRVLNLNNREGLVRDILRKELTENNYEVVFTGGLSMYYPHIKDIVKYTREFSPDTKTVVGGGIITAQPGIMYNLIKPDFGVIGEGEVTAVDLVSCLETGIFPTDVDGLIFKMVRDQEATVIVTTPPRKPVMNLDSLPFPDYEPFGFDGYLGTIKMTDNNGLYGIVDKPRPYPVLASRGCPFSCSFCFHPLGQKYRQRSIDNVMKEIKENVEKYNINIISLYDELFSSDRGRVIEFCTKFKKYSDTLPYKLWFTCNCRVDITTDEMMKIMKDSGAYLLSFGFESYSPVVLNSMKKHIAPEQIKTAVKMARENGLGIMGSFIFGDVAETCETAKETLDFIRENRRLLGANVGAFFVIPFQGTPLYKQCVTEGKIPDEIAFIEEREKNWFKYLEPMNMTGLSGEQFESLKNAVFGIHLVSGTYTVPRYKHHVEKKNEMIVVSATLLATCPSCGRDSEYTGLVIPESIFGVLTVGCRHCNFRFNLVSRLYFLKRLLIQAFGFKTVYWASSVWRRSN